MWRARNAHLRPGKRERMRTHPCVRLFCLMDTLTITSMLPGVGDSIDDAASRGRPGRSRPHLQYVTANAARRCATRR
jgi:hypothetical protein